MLDFDQWKSEFEQETHASFIRATGKKAVSGKIITYYYCNRSGYFNPTGQNVRALKSQGIYCENKFVLYSSNCFDTE